MWFKIRLFSGVVRFPDVGEALRASASLHESYLDIILYTHNMNKSISSLLFSSGFFISAMRNSNFDYKYRVL